MSLTLMKQRPDQQAATPSRVDGVAKVRGVALYVDDLPCADVIYGATVRTTEAG